MDIEKSASVLGSEIQKAKTKKDLKFKIKIIKVENYDPTETKELNHFSNPTTSVSRDTEMVSLYSYNDSYNNNLHYLESLKLYFDEAQLQIERTQDQNDKIH